MSTTPTYNPMDRAIAHSEQRQIADPAAGASASFTPANLRHCAMIHCSCLFTAAAAVANRFVQFTITSGGVTSILAVTDTLITATQIRQIQFGAGGIALEHVANTHLFIPIPPNLYIAAGDSFGILVDGIQALDTITDIIVWEDYLLK